MKLLAATVALLLAIIQIQTAVSDEQQETTESAAEAISEPPIKLVHVLNPGEREFLSPNLIGVQNIAMTFLPLSFNFVNIIDAFREIVNGVRYEIHLNAVDTKAKDADTICRLVILEKPWLTTQWGDRYRELVNSNCSDAADNALTPADAEERGKALNEKYVSNTIFNGGQRNELSDNEMANLEKQILSTLPAKRRVNNSAVSSSSNSDSHNIIASSSASVSSSAQVAPTNEPTTSISVDESAATAAVVDTKVQAEGGEGEGEGDAEGEANTTIVPTPELNDNEKRWLDDILSVGAYNFEKTIEQQRTGMEQQKQRDDEPKEQQQQEGEQEEQEQVQQEATTAAATAS